MQHQLYDPFKEFQFADHICFLTGKVLAPEERYFVQAFPTWLMDRYEIAEKSINMLDSTQLKYTDMRLPACKEVADAISAFDDRTRLAFEKGYEGIKELSDLTLFQWVARIFYGVNYQEFLSEIKMHEDFGKKMKLSENMYQKFKSLLNMMQSFLRPVKFLDFTPWSIVRFPVNVSKDILNYRDDTRNFNFNIIMNGFGIICCLQDNGNIAQHYKDTLDKIGDDTVLHPAQFVELYGKFLYSNYLAFSNDSYIITEDENTIIFELPEDRKAPGFAPWDEKIYGQVLTNMWKPWGIQINQIYNPPNSTLSFLINDWNGEFIKFENVKLPY